MGLCRYRQTGTQAIECGDGWRLVDPKLIEYESGRVRFSEDSAAYELGIETIDVSGAGCAQE
jgi:hypothetical protein